ncbi:MAG: T9SS type A sorting domain-containing protein [Flavobacteriales bacterium]|nr:T9SS type A sorting domain-containing protein [Flavobacteriales bacterium]
MRKTLLASILLPAGLYAQTLWPVNMAGSTAGGPLPSYNPQHLTIAVGDQVRWTNVSGSHSANGSLVLYPGNPEGFSTGNPDGGSWSYTFTFTIPGFYQYHCTQDGHSATQFGSITVVDPGTGLAEVGEAGEEVKVYPSPATSMLIVETDDNHWQRVTVISLNGETLLNGPVNNGGLITLDVADLAAGNYFVLLTDARGRVIAKPFSKD